MEAVDQWRPIFVGTRPRTTRTPPPIMNEGVTIIIPCRNGAAWLSQAIRSAQDCAGAVAVVVVDDGSTDESRTIAASFAPQVMLLALAARGGNAARNEGLRVATTPWVQFLDADDYLTPRKLAVQFTEAGRMPGPADILYSPVYEETWQNGSAQDRRVSALDPDTDIFTQWITWQLPQTGGALWRRETLLALGGWNESQPCCQEHELYLRALQAGLRFRHCPSPGAVYRIWSEDTVCRKDPVLVIRERTRLIDACIAGLKASGGLGPHHLEAAGQACFEMARTWARHDPREANRYARARGSRGLFLMRGPAAPASYRFVSTLAGFRAAEWVARATRPARPDE